MTLRSFIALTVFSSLLLSCSQNPPETIVVPLEKVNESVSRGLSYWMNGQLEITNDTANPERVASVKSMLHGTIPVEIVFNEDSTVTYNFSEEYESITVPMDSMRVYRKRARHEIEGEVPSWRIGEMQRDGFIYDVWLSPDGNVSFNDKGYLDDFAVEASIGNVYKGVMNTPEGDVNLDIKLPVDYHIMPMAIIPAGNYEDFSSFRPDINGGLITQKERSIGEMIQTGKNTFYHIDSINPTYTEMYLSLVKEMPALIKANEEAMGELKPYLDIAGNAGKLLLIDFWGTWCGPCKAAMPRLREIEENYADKINVLSVLEDSPENFELANQILDENGLTGERLARQNEALTRYFGVTAFPTYILNYNDGSILTRGSSVKTLDWIEEHYLK
ncbi:MAG: TlpA family protein disulfide reductase [Muribaculaceae bacterium]|nr:TlpA family protein disulfide reductase [Muribaculaceae bacterium]